MIRLEDLMAHPAPGIFGACAGPPTRDRGGGAWAAEWDDPLWTGLRRESLMCIYFERFTQKMAVTMRTNIDIDDALLAEAMAATGLKTKRRVVEAGLRLLARRKRQADASKLFGRARWEGDLHRERLDEPADADRSP